MKKLIIIIAVVLFSTVAGAQDWNSSPQNWENSPSNWQNSPNNWNNNPNNWDNSPQKWGNDRIVRDTRGNPTGYVVPKQDGGVNMYDLKGNRTGYTPPADHFERKIRKLEDW